MNRVSLTAAILLGFILDLIFGDPQVPWHPVRLIGHLTAGAERVLRNVSGTRKRRLFAAGIVLAAVVCTVTAFVSGLLLYAAKAVSPVLGFFVSSVLCWLLFAARSLKTESMKVCRALEDGDTEKARRAVSMIVGRDTEPLTAEGIMRAAVETVAENTSDGVIAPLFYTALGGPVLGWVYKAVNTMDSMVGYKNEKYLWFGRAAARLDDAANFIPARISGILTVASAFLLGYDGKNAWRIFLRDRRNHASPNSAQTEAACAGALDVVLGGDAYYFGTLYRKKTIGDGLRPIAADDIRRANRLMYTASFLMLALAAAAGILL